MYTSYIGKKFLTIYNQKENQNLTAQEFFCKIMFPLFFDDEKHLMHVGNSPFFQKVSEKNLETGLTKSQIQLFKLQRDIQNDTPNMGIFVGFAAKDIEGTTSGQLTDMDFRIDSEEMYASWIGEALGIGVSGGFVMLLDQEEILWNLFQGWTHYRNYLKQTPHIKDKQIETWNGNWICHRLPQKETSGDPCDGISLNTTEVQGKNAIATKEWAQLILVLAKKYPGCMMTSYAYNLSQTNTTLGFINLHLPQIKSMYELLDKIFLNGQESVLKDSQIQQLQPFYHFKEACKLGTIGLKALEPDKLRDYMPIGSIPYSKGKYFKLEDESSNNIYQLYKLWIIAMLNKTELLQIAGDVAKALLEFESQDSRGKTEHKRIAEELRSASHIKIFIDKMTEVLSRTPQHAELFKSVVEQVLKMPSDNFPLFITLVRFEYAYQQSKK